MVTAELYQIIQGLNREDGITIIMISHDIAAAIKYASHILHIGPTIYYGTKEDYVNSPLGQRFLEESGVTE